MKYIDVEEMRVVTNDKHIAQQIQNGSKVGEFGKVVKEQKFEEHRDEWSQKCKILENNKI